MKFKGITLRNFMSTGQVTQAISLESDALTLILGENRDLGTEGSGHRNGVGKTVLINAISFALFGTAITNIKKDNLINIINKKNMMVTLDFEKDGIQYRIERGRKPAIFRFLINGSSFDATDNAQGDSRETQDAINELVGLSNEMFKHIVTLNTYTEPFLAMKAADQREIIEQLLGMTILSDKAEQLKTLIKQTKDEIFKETARIDAIKTANDNIHASIKTLKLRQSMWNDTKINEIAKLETAITSLSVLNIDQEIENHQTNTAIQELTRTKQQHERDLQSLNLSLKQNTLNINKYGQELLSLSEMKCPTCKQDIHDHNHEELITSTTKILEEALATEATLTTNINNITKDLNTIGTIPPKFDTQYSTLADAYNHKLNLDQLTTQLNAKQNEVDTYQEQINTLENTALQPIDWTNVNALKSMQDHQEFLLKLLTNKDSYIRKKIIDQNLAYLNSRLDHYLDKLGLPHHVMFKNDLSVEITQLGQNLDFHNLSRGEMNRLIISLSLSFRDVWESLYQPINLLIVDELIDNGTDAIGVHNAMNAMNTIAHDRNKNVFIVSHRDELITKCDNILKVIKTNGFTTYELNQS